MRGASTSRPDYFVTRFCNGASLLGEKNQEPQHILELAWGTCIHGFTSRNVLAFIRNAVDGIEGVLEEVLCWPVRILSEPARPAIATHWPTLWTRFELK
jgi:hypothetical protein